MIADQGGTLLGLTKTLARADTYTKIIEAIRDELSGTLAFETAWLCLAGTFDSAIDSWPD